MDTRTLEQLHIEEASLESARYTEEPRLPALVARRTPPVKPVTKRASPSPRKRRIRVGREVVKSGMAASLAVSMLSGLRIIRPMSIHPVASWIFVGLTVIHMIAYDKMGKSGRSASSP